MTLPGNERVGTLTAGGTEYKMRLAAERPSPYRPSYRLVWPEYQNVAGSDGKVAGDPVVRQWHVDDWSAGEGEDLWEKGYFEESTNVRPKPTGSGLVLGAYRELTVDDQGTPATFAQGTRLGYGLGKLWACKSTTVHEWQPSTEDWDNTGTATGAAGVATSVVDGMDGTNLLIGTAANEVEKVAPGGANSTLETGLAYDPVMRVFGATVYCLVGDDLYTIDSTTGLSASAVSEPDGESDEYLTGTVAITYGRLSTSDVGPIWFQRLDSGQTFIWEYNEASDTTTRIGRLPVDFAYPYSIFWAQGFTFVGFRYASLHTESGDAYVYYQRGAQRGVAGPFRAPSTGTSSKAVLIAGMIGDDLVTYYDGALWGYNLTSGGIYMIGRGDESSGNNVRDAITFGKDAFASNIDGNDTIERFATDIYSTDTATLTTGRFDLDYLGIDKTLLDVKVVTDPLPAGTSVTLSTSANGGTFTAATGTHNTNDATRYTWTISNSTTSVTGEDFNLKLGLASTGNTSTPTVRSLTARAIGDEKQRGWILELDVGTFDTGRAGDSPRSSDALADFRAWAETSGLVKFSNPWDGEEWDSSTAYHVVVEQALLVEAEPEGPAFLQVQLREAGYV